MPSSTARGVLDNQVCNACSICKQGGKCCGVECGGEHEWESRANTRVATQRSTNGIEAGQDDLANNSHGGGTLRWLR